MKKFNLLGLSVVTIGLLVGCGSSNTDGSGVDTGTGYYVDSAVEGVDYVCGAKSGTTLDNGEFTFEVGKDCTFSVAGIPLRTTKADALVDGEKVFEDNAEVARFLQSIDNDGNPENGIQIKKEILDVLKDALAENDSAGTLPKDATLDTVVASVVKDVSTFEGRVKTLEEAKEHSNRTQTEITKELLAGKTFYHVGVNPDGSVDSLEKNVVNTTATVMTYSCIEGCEDNKDNGSINITVVGNSIVFEDGDKATLTKQTSDYLLFEDSYGKHYLYGSEAKAKAYYDSLSEDRDSTTTDDTYRSDINPMVLAGKTIYGVGSVMIESTTFSADMTTATWKNEYGVGDDSQQLGNTGSLSIEVNGDNSIYFNGKDEAVWIKAMDSTKIVFESTTSGNKTFYFDLEYAKSVYSDQ